jgi:soluble lytic murein transglycosylase
VTRRLATLVAVAAVAAAGYAYLQAAKPAWWERIRYPLAYAPIVRGHARHYRLDPALLAAVIYQESRFRADVRSRSGAIGLMQLLPDTAKGIAVHTGGSNFHVADLYDPEINVRYGAWYLRHLEDRYGDEETALAAYNAGQDNVDRWRREGVGIQFAETRAYVRRVEELKEIYRRAYRDELYANAATAISPARAAAAPTGSRSAFGRSAPRSAR